MIDCIFISFFSFEWEYMGHFYDSIKITVFKNSEKARLNIKLFSKYHQGLYK